ncbi:MAG: cation:proton antiporter [Bacteroidaceae bacterium]|nr:cation:proton antiporter [Bacteroidaceae bacterium]MBP5322711.1 cation:proton antiporter [Bacteroidaceae bacterium]
MGHTPQLITDLALILVLAGIMSLLFKKLKQPVVLGYIVAGFLASPYMPYTPSVLDSNDISIWADIGVIFLLFSLGLEFRIKKLLMSGSTPIIAVTTSVTCMITIGIIIGHLFGWSFMDGLYLGGMMSMSSTSIIIKAFDDLGVRQQKFAGLVFSVLIIEDIIAIVMMLLFGTLGEGKQVEGMEILLNIGKLVFFIVLWFVVGIYLIPLLLKKIRPLLNEETLLIVSLSLCFLMVVLSTAVGFSSAFGAFVMGSILAETLESEKIEHLTAPVKDLFGAIFFVSVGMMINPALLLKYWLPIVVITLVMIIIRSSVDTLGFILGGTPIKTAVKCGYSLAQVGEFSFIIATLGISLGAISEFIYPIIVSVCVLTTFTTPYMIKASDKVGDALEARIPEKWKERLNRYDRDTSVLNNENKWKKMLKAMLSPILIYGVLCIAILIASFQLMQPLLEKAIPSPWDSVVGLSVTLLVLTPFLRPLLLRHCFTHTFWELWGDKQVNRAPLLAIVILRAAMVVALIVVCVKHYSHVSLSLLVGIVVLTLISLLFSRRIKQRQQQLEEIFIGNLNTKDNQSETQKPQYAGELQSRDIHLTEVVIPAFSSWCGKTLKELDWGRRYEISVASILREGRRINIPGAKEQLFPNDKLQIIGTDDNISHFVEAMAKRKTQMESLSPVSSGEMHLHQIAITHDSPLVNMRVLDSGIRNEFRCLIVGIDRGEGPLLKPTPELEFREGDIVWIVGEQENIRNLAKQIRQ